MSRKELIDYLTPPLICVPCVGTRSRHYLCNLSKLGIHTKSLRVIQLGIYKMCYNSRITNYIRTDTLRRGTIQKEQRHVRAANSPTRQQRSHEQHPSQGAKRRDDGPVRVRFERVLDVHPAGHRRPPERVECDPGHERGDCPGEEYQRQRHDHTTPLQALVSIG